MRYLRETSVMEQLSIFISYSHADEKEKDELMTHLRVLERTGIMDQWSDEKIAGGDNWREEIHRAMRNADFAIFLITANFLNSIFIQDEEVPTLLKRHEEDGIVIFPILAKHCLWQSQEWLIPFNVRPRNNDPVWSGNDGDVDKKLTAIVGEIDKLLNKSSTSFEAKQLSQYKKNKGGLVEYKINMAEILCCFFDRNNRLWISDINEVNIFQSNNPEPIKKIMLPKLRYKNFLQTTWRNSLVCSDWDGSLYQFDSGEFADGRAMREPKFNDLPIHYLTVDIEDQLNVATWDGKILRWDKYGEPLPSNPIIIPYLPIKVLSLPDGSFVVVDQKNYLTLFDKSGAETWKWQAGDNIQDVWFYTQRGTNHKYIFILLTSNEIIKIFQGSDTLEDREKLNSKVVAISHFSELNNKGHSVLALEGGTITWLSWSPFKMLNNYQVDVDFEVKMLRTVYDPHRPNTFVAIALSQEGKLFSIDDKAITHYPCEKTFSFLLDNYGRYLALIHEANITLIPNPAITSSTCEAEVVANFGKLIVGEYKEIIISVRNTGKIPINEIQASLLGPDCIQASTSESKEDKPISPTEVIDLKFQVKALVVGDALPLELYLDLKDDFNQSAHPLNFKLLIQSKRAMNECKKG